MDKSLAESIAGSAGEGEREKRNAVYSERNRLAIAFALATLNSGGKAGLRYDNGNGTSDYWHYVVVAYLPDGREVGWHMPPSEEALARALLPMIDTPWDGTYIARQEDWPKALLAQGLGALAEGKEGQG